MHDSRGAQTGCCRLVRGFDPAVVPLCELAEMIQNACDIGKMMTTAATLGAEHRAATGPGSTATRRAIRELAHAAGTSLGEASRAMKAAQQLRDQPEVASAAKAGDLSSAGRPRSRRGRCKSWRRPSASGAGKDRLVAGVGRRVCTSDSG